MSKKSLMLISKDRNIYKEIDRNKTSTGSFFTKKEVWLNKPINDFISKIIAGRSVMDPFAGDGHLLDVCKEKFNCDVYGFDIQNPKWQKNDSLINIPNPHNSIIVTNPPYLAKYSAKRKGVLSEVEKYFDSEFEDLYQLALQKCIESADYVVAIIPETFLNSTFSKFYLSLVSVLEENPFDDTETPVCVACFSKEKKQDGDLYIGNEYCGKYEEIFRYRLGVIRDKDISFNKPNGQFALKAVDGTSADDRIRFIKSADFQYSRDKIKNSSRLLTYLDIPNIHDSEIEDFIKKANKNIEEMRLKTSDLIFSPFKGNNKIGKRRRRLDYTLARIIIEKTLIQMSKRNLSQNDLFN